MRDRVRIGIIGSGHMGNLHARNYMSISESDIVGVYDFVPEVAKSLAAFCRAKMYTNLSDILENSDIDAVAICTPPHTHRDLAVEAAKHKKHILLEKPIARTLKGADDIINAVKKFGVKLLVSHQSRFGLAKVKRSIENGAIGQVTVIKSTVLGWTPPSASSWYHKENIGGGVTIDTCSHQADLFRWLVNSEVSRVYAEGDALVLDGAKKEKTHDNVEILLKFKNGVIGEIYGSWSQKAGSGKLDIYGTEGSLFVDSMGSPIRLFAKKNFTDLEPEDLVSQGWNFLNRLSLREEGGWFQSDKHFIDCLINDKAPLISGEDGKAALEIVLAAYESAKTRKPITLPLKKE